MNRCPIYIPSKSRADSRLTMRALDGMGVSYRVIVEEQQHDEYAAVLGEEKLLVLPRSYQERYDTCDDLGLTKSPGPGPARNFAWDHSIASGAKWHWVMDDNIRCFYRLNRNQKIRLGDGAAFRIMEDWCARHLSVAMAGPAYAMFNPRRLKLLPLIMNTRIYSCNLIRNDVPFRWRGRYNEDTDLSLVMLKAGWCTVQFRAFLQQKMVTQAVKGGNTEAFYASEGTGPKSEMLVRLHPDVTRLRMWCGRIHHWVDYRPFAKNRLMRDPTAAPPIHVEMKTVDKASRHPVFGNSDKEE